MATKGNSTMLVPTLIMAALAVILVFIGYSKGEGQHVAGLKAALTLLVRVLPLLVFAFVIAGMMQVLIPQELISKWVGVESGIRGIMLGTLVGGLTPGGPYIAMPVAAGIMGAGASVGTMVAFMTSWSLWSIARLPMEAGILGWKFTLIRVASTFIFPPLAGMIAHFFFRGVKLM